MGVLTPPEILRRRFRRSLFGYSRREVHDFLQEVSETVQTLLEENRTLREERQRLLERLQVYEGLERQLRDALVVAEKVAEEVKENARKEAHLIVAQAHQEAERLKADAQQKAQHAYAEVERLRQVRQRLETELRHLLQAYLETLDRSKPSEGGD
ncbi:MAG: DivIVA domain-containing protein [Armatimonadota bacterium]|jgi:cell division initiation protein|nr:DivIVA domain-containing protein [Armatimonadota bacterium]MDT7971584.1 DivIVA domain-containing protein [Armatimonadota bacterium]